MNVVRLFISMGVLFAFLSCKPNLHAQVSTASKLALDVVETIMSTGANKGARELAEVGGERAVQEVLEVSIREGGDALAIKVATYTKTYGSAILLGSKKSPARFIQAFDAVPPDLKSKSLQAMTRDPELVAELTTRFGTDALVAVAKQPGIAAPFIKTFGAEGAQTLGKLTTDQSVQLVRMSGPLSKIPPESQKQLLDMIGRAPEKVLDLLESHPKVLGSATGLVAFLAAKDQILGDEEIVITPDGKIHVVQKHGLIERLLGKDFSFIFYIAGVGVAGWFAIKLWGAWRRERSKSL